MLSFASVALPANLPLVLPALAPVRRYNPLRFARNVRAQLPEEAPNTPTAAVPPRAVPCAPGQPSPATTTDSPASSKLRVSIRKLKAKSKSRHSTVPINPVVVRGERHRVFYPELDVVTSTAIRNKPAKTGYHSLKPITGFSKPVQARFRRSLPGDNPSTSDKPKLNRSAAATNNVKSAPPPVPKSIRNTRANPKAAATVYRYTKLAPAKAPVKAPTKAPAKPSVPKPQGITKPTRKQASDRVINLLKQAVAAAQCNTTVKEIFGNAQVCYNPRISSFSPGQTLTAAGILDPAPEPAPPAKPISPLFKRAIQDIAKENHILLVEDQDLIDTFGYWLYYSIFGCLKGAPQPYPALPTVAPFGTILADY